MAEDLAMLSLSELLETLKQRGIDTSLPALSRFVKTGDIAQQLRVGGKGNRLEFLPDCAEILTAFFPEFKRAGGKLPQAPGMLRSFLKQENRGEGGEGRALVPVAEEFAQTGKLLLKDAQVALLTDAVFNAQEAADFLRITSAALRKFGPPAFARYGKTARGDRWRKSDLLRGGK